MSMKEMVDKLNGWAYQYYVLDCPTVSDAEYDELYDKLIECENKEGVILPDSPSQRVGGAPITAFKSAVHVQRLYSLDKAQSEAELLAWEVRARKICPELEFTVEYKFDGLTMVLTYENGQLMRAATRGNGAVGEDVTEQVKTIKSYPMTISEKGHMEVQGEAVMRLSVLEKYNQKAVEPLKNARNAAAGAVRNLDPKVTASRNLDIYFYAVNTIEGVELYNQFDSIAFLREHHFKLSPYFKVCQTMAEVLLEIKDIGARRNTLDFLIDGVVVKVNSFAARERLGFTEKFPRFAIAYKFEAEEMTTILQDVIWQVGRTGKLTPLGILEPVELAGVTVKRATLNNYGDIERKKVKLGARVLIRRSNDVIPEILGVSELTAQCRDIPKPIYCPECGTALYEEGANLFCPNEDDCVPQIVGRLQHFGSRDAMDIEGFSDKTAMQLHTILGIKYTYELYDLNVEKLTGLDGFKEKKIDNLLQSLQRSKTCSLATFLYALGILNVGKKTAKDLADAFKSLECLRSATREQLLQIPEVGEIIADSIVKFMNDPFEQRTMDKLLNSGIRFEAEYRITEGSFKGEKVVLTGVLVAFKRSEAAKLIEARGGEVQSAVNRETTLVVAGENAGSKLDKAQKLGVRVIDEGEFAKLL